MVIMALSYAQKSGDLSQLRRYVRFVLVSFVAGRVSCCSQQYGLLDQWTQFLITDSLIPENQISTDDFAGSLANQTNLAIKGIVGIKAMAQIASLLGDETRASNYSVCQSSPRLTTLSKTTASIVYCCELCHKMAITSSVIGWLSFDTFSRSPLTHL